LQDFLRVGVDLVGSESVSAPANIAGKALEGIGEAAHGAEGMLIALGAVSTATAATLVLSTKAASDLQYQVALLSTMRPTIDTSGMESSLNLMQTRVEQSSTNLAQSLGRVMGPLNASTEDSLALVEQLGRGAIGAATDLETFTRAITGETNAMGLGIGDAQHVMDVFFTTVATGVITGEALASELQRLSVSAHDAGVSVDELGALIVAVNKNGGDARQNVAGLRSLFENWDTSKSEKAFSDFGVSLRTASGDGRDIVAVLTDVRDKMVNYTDEAKRAYLTELFPNAREREAAISLIQHLDDVRAGIDKNKDSAGAADEAWKKMSETFDGMSKALGLSVESVITSMGGGFLPVIQAGLDGVQKFVTDSTTDFDRWKTMLNTAFKTGGFSGWISELGVVGGEMATAVGKWGGPFLTWANDLPILIEPKLKAFWDKTLSPWLGDQADKLGTKVHDDWIPALLKWWNAPETQTDVTKAMDVVGDTATRWAADGQPGNVMFKAVGASLGGAVKDGLMAGLALSDAWLQDLTDRTRAAIKAAILGTKPTTVDGVDTNTVLPSGAMGPTGTTMAPPGWDPNTHLPPGAMAPTGTSTPALSAGLVASGIPPSGAAGTHYSPYDDVFRQFAGAYAEDERLIAIIAAGTSWESAGGQGWNAGSTSGDQGHSWGLFQMHDQGAGAGMGAARLDPGAASAVMVPAYVASYQAALAQGRTGADLAAYTIGGAERPYGWGGSAPFNQTDAYGHYANTYTALMASGPTASPTASPGGAPAGVTTDGQGNYYAPDGTPLLTSTPGPSNVVHGSSTTLSGTGWDTASASGPGGPGTEDPMRLTTDRLLAALGNTDVTEAAGKDATAIMAAFDDAINHRTPTTIATLAGTLESLKGALMADTSLTPEAASAHFTEVMAHVQAAIEDGTPEGEAALKSYLGGLAKTVADEDLATKLGDLAQKASDASNVEIENTQVAITAAYGARDAAINKLHTDEINRANDKSLQQAETDQEQARTAAAQQYVKDQEAAYQAFHAMLAQQRSDLEAIDALQQKQSRETGNLLAQKSATDMSGVMAPTAHVDPQASVNQQLRDLKTTQTQAMQDLKDQQTQKAADHAQDVAWRADEATLAANLKTNVLDPTAATVRQMQTDYAAFFATTVTIPRQAATAAATAQTTVDGLNSKLTSSLAAIQSQEDVTAKSLTDQYEKQWPAIKAVADTAYDGAVAKSAIIRQNLIDAYNAQGGTNSSGYTTGSTSSYMPPKDNGSDPNNGYPPPILPPVHDPTEWNPAPTNAGGTPDWMGGWTMVGEQGPEWAKLPVHSAVYPTGTGGPGGGGQVRLHPDDIAAIVQGLSKLTIQVGSQVLGSVVRSADRRYAQSNLAHGVGGL
jgi:TP901 family phage tail tape measure protein